MVLKRHSKFFVFSLILSTSLLMVSCGLGLNTGSSSSSSLGALQVVAGDYHTCALLPNRKVRCWGDNQYGQLGYGNTDNIGDNEFPSSVGPVDVGGPVTQLAAGAEHTCAVVSGKSIRCWGHANEGQLGYGNTTNVGDSLPPSSVGDVQVTN